MQDDGNNVANYCGPNYDVFHLLNMSLAVFMYDITYSSFPDMITVRYVLRFCSFTFFFMSLLASFVFVTRKC